MSLWRFYSVMQGLNDPYSQEFPQLWIFTYPRNNQVSNPWLSPSYYSMQPHRLVSMRAHSNGLHGKFTRHRNSSIEITPFLYPGTPLYLHQCRYLVNLRIHHHEISHPIEARDTLPASTRSSTHGKTYLQSPRTMTPACLSTCSQGSGVQAITCSWPRLLHPCSSCCPRYPMLEAASSPRLG